MGLDVGNMLFQICESASERVLVGPGKADRDGEACFHHASPTVEFERA
jgi:hypothetical protein